MEDVYGYVPMVVYTLLLGTILCSIFVVLLSFVNPAYRFYFKRLSLVYFAVAALSFAGAFADITGEGMTTRIHGFELLSGIVSRRGVVVQKQPLAIGAFMSAILGFGLAFLKRKTGSILTAIMGLSGIFMLWLLSYRIQNEYAFVSFPTFLPQKPAPAGLRQ